MQTGRTLKGYFLTQLVPFLSNPWLHSIWILVSLFKCDFKIIYLGIPSKIHSMVFHYSLSRENLLYKDSVTSQTHSYMAFWLQIYFPNASADNWLQQSCCNWSTTIRRYGLQRTEFHQIITNDDGDHNVGGLLSLRYFCSRLWQYHSSSYHKVNPFNSEEVRIVCIRKF